jgi:hypothetical protein
MSGDPHDDRQDGRPGGKAGALAGAAGGAVAGRSSASDVSAFIAAAKRAPRPGSGRLILALDATLSRQPTWDMAVRLQADMFAAAAKTSGLAMQLVYFRGLGECRASRFATDGAQLAAMMSKVSCAGGLTQIGKVFGHALKEHETAPVAALVFIGDAFEEEVDEVADLAGRMGLKGIPAFLFQEGSDPVAQRAMQEFARLSGGAWFRFDRSSAARLSELLKAIAVYASGGRTALTSDTSDGARLLLQHIGGKRG